LKRNKVSQRGYWVRHGLLYVVTFGVLLCLPLFLNELLIHIIILILLYGLLGMSWNILGGYGGQFSFGHAAFFGIGAYTSSLLFYYYQISPWLGMILGAILATPHFGVISRLPLFPIQNSGDIFPLRYLCLFGNPSFDRSELPRGFFQRFHGHPHSSQGKRTIVFPVHLKSSFLLYHIVLRHRFFSHQLQD